MLYFTKFGKPHFISVWLYCTIHLQIMQCVDIIIAKKAMDYVHIKRRGYALDLHASAP